MKQFILMFTAIMFLANTFAVSAWAKPCMNMQPASSISANTDAEMPPCHEQQDQQKTVKHCNGVCLCLHVAVNQTPMLADTIGLVVPAMKTDRELASQDLTALWATSPPRRPPKLNS